MSSLSSDVVHERLIGLTSFRERGNLQTPTFIVAVAALLGSGWLVAQIMFKFGLVVLVVAPVAVVLGSRKYLGTPVCRLDSSLLFSSSFAVFFVAGIATLHTSSGLRYASVGEVNKAFVISTTLQLSAIVSALCSVSMTSSLSFSPAGVPVCARKLTVFAQALFASVLAGTVITSIELGGVVEAARVLSEHNKALTATIGNSTGLSVWQLTALPACVALSTVIVLSQQKGWVRYFVCAELVSVLAAALLIYGSRLLVTLAAVGFGGVYYCVRGRMIRWTRVALAGLTITLLSIPLLADRTGQDNFSAIDDLASIIGYDVFNVSMASVDVQSTIGSELNAPERPLIIAQSIVPMIGTSARSLAPYRLDAIVANHIDGGNSRRGLLTGFPPSLPSALLLQYGVFLGVVIGGVLGYTSALALNILEFKARSSQSAVWIFWYGLGAALLFNAFKDGDMLINLAGALKNIFVLLLMYVLISIGSRSRRGTTHG